MAEISTIARPYAQAAFDVAQSDNALSNWATFLSDAATVASQPEVHEIANNPRVSAAQLLSLFEAAIGVTHDSQRNFLATLVNEGRVDALSAISTAFLAHKHAFEGSADAHIVSAYPMADSEVADVTAALEKKFGKKLNATVSVDESLIGGFSVAVGDEVLDMSVRAKLVRMQTALTA
ncbi:ATP synthase subunit delta [Formosimonas limnophila]|uniref:ATP synthase subunit delta n=1 Tax=Formosimonas limnophila TaxID=1384487 RepID=A0A8J3CL50_9BURK|nr:F0F1 ATP synthase subunit delta [Formosimonas limnophila]GHA72095.1 ATP synthase subunit delta [Formosimonas limnophila]